MRKARTYWQETCAALAILVGLGLAGVSWADFTWPSNVGPTPTNYNCNAGTGNCFQWSEECLAKGSQGVDNIYFTCGNTIWNSLKIQKFKQYGQCNSGSGSCTQWKEYYCIYWYVYKDGNCGNMACDLVNGTINGCDPDNPTGQ